MEIQVKHSNERSEWRRRMRVMDAVTRTIARQLAQVVETHDLEEAVRLGEAAEEAKRVYREKVTEMAENVCARVVGRKDKW